MSTSLREQLLKAGLVTERQARQAEKDQHRRGKQPSKRDSASRPPVTQGSAGPGDAKAARDRELNRLQQEKAAAKARAAEIRQIVEQHRVPRPETDEYFNFQDGTKIRRVTVSPDIRRRLLAGDLVIVRADGRYEFLTREAAERVREREASAVVDLPASSAGEPGPDDPYRDFVVPDDLRW